MATSSASAALTAIYAGTPARDAYLYKGTPFTISGTYEKVAGNTNNDYIGLCRVNRDWSVSTLFLANDALTSLTDINVGLVTYDGTSFTDVDENCYADAIDINAGVGFTDRAYTTRDISKCGQYVWQDAGYSTRADAPEWLVIAIHIQAASTATGTISWRIGVIAP